MAAGYFGWLRPALLGQDLARFHNIDRVCHAGNTPLIKEQIQRAARITGDDFLNSIFHLTEGSFMSLKGPLLMWHSFLYHVKKDPAQWVS